MYEHQESACEAHRAGRRRLLMRMTGVVGLGLAPGLSGWTGGARAALLPPVPLAPPRGASSPATPGASDVAPASVPAAAEAGPPAGTALPPPAPAPAAPPASYAAPAPDPGTPQETKAAYLHKFASYVEWPPGAFPTGPSPLVVAVAGADDVADALARIVRGRPVRGRFVRVMRSTRGPVDAASPVHMVFVGREAWKQLPAWVAALHSRPVLLVTDAPGGLDAGAMLAFLQNEGRVRFEAAPRAAERAGLRLGARLLAVAERVQGGTP